MTFTTKYNRDDIYQYIVDYCQMHNGLPPVMREIGAATGISSTSVVAYALGNLEKLGRISRDDSGRIMVNGAKWIAPRAGEVVEAKYQFDREAQGILCTCGGYARQVEPSAEETEKYGCFRDKVYQCCVRAFECGLCGLRTVGGAEPPDYDAW
jgi:SOS-response transcriptional repressor LexA